MIENCLLCNSLFILTVYTYMSIFNLKDHNLNRNIYKHYVKMNDPYTTIANVALDIKKNILTENEGVLKEMYTKEAEIAKEGIKIKTSAFKEGMSGTKTKYCKHCGALIDSDSAFCKSCGKRQ